MTFKPNLSNPSGTLLLATVPGKQPFRNLKEIISYSNPPKWSFPRSSIETLQIPIIKVE